MDFNTALISAIGCLSSVVGLVSKILWDRSVLCESERRTLQTRIEKLERDYGHAVGRLETIKEFEMRATQRIPLP